MSETEATDANIRMVGWVLAGLAVVVVAAAVAVYVYLNALGGPVERAGPLPDQSSNFPPPRLRVAPLGEPQAYAREKAPLLTGVEKAIDELARSGWPPEGPWPKPGKAPR